MDDISQADIISGDISGDPAVLTINLSAVADNYRILQNKTGDAEIAAVMKADAYGLGMKHIFPVFKDLGCATFFVATLKEAITLRTLDSGVTIYALNGLQTGEHKDFLKYKIRPVINSLTDICTWQEIGQNTPCALHFDTGMNRLGLSTDETEKFFESPETYTRDLDIQLILSHFANADEENDPLTKQQIDRFEHIRTALPDIPASLCNSPGIFAAPEAHYDLIRPGMALYGLNPTPYADNPMKPVVSLDVRVLKNFIARAGETVGYGASYKLDKDERLATVSLGYGDGFFRSFTGDGKLYWKGKPCPIRGRVSMDTVTVSIEHLDHPPREGDMLEVIGPSQSVDDLAATAQGLVSNYEILTDLGRRYRRIYLT